MLLQHISFGRPFGSCFKPNFQYTTSMMNEVAATSEETTAYTVGSAIGKLIGLKRMVELTFDDLKRPLYSKDELMNEVETVINKLNTITYPYKI